MGRPRRGDDDAAAPKSCPSVSSPLYGLRVLGLPIGGGRASRRCFCGTREHVSGRQRATGGVLTCAFALQKSAENGRLYTVLQLYSSTRPRDTPSWGARAKKIDR